MTLVQARTPVVIDASVAIAFVAEEDAEVDAAWASWVSSGTVLMAPAHVWPEVGNGLMRGRGASRDDAAALLDDLAGSGLEATDRGVQGVRDALYLADRHRLSVYDALYLSLAIDIDAELATRDKAMIKAARAEGVPLAL